MRLLLLGIILWLFALVAFSDTIVNTASQPVNMRVVGAMAAATPTGTPSGGGPGATPSPTPTPSAFDPLTIPGMKGWWKADAITTSGGLLRKVLLPLLLTQIPSIPGATIEPVRESDEIEPQIANGDPVSSWPDSSGNGKHFASTYGSPPTYQAGVINGKPIVRFLADAFHVMDGASITVPQPDTIIIVAKKPNVATNGLLIDANNPSDRQLLQIDPNTGYLQCVTLLASGGLIGFSDSVNHQGGFHVFTGVFNGASSQSFVDGVLAATGDTSNRGIAGSLRLQCDSGGTALSEYDMAEILIYDHALTTTERTNLEASLKAKYALP